MFKALFKRHLNGLMVASTGAIFVPATQYAKYVRPAHWTYGHKQGKYRMITVNWKRIYVHVLVAEAFLNRKPGDEVVDHIDRDPSNNAWWNLRFCTQAENLRNKASYDQARLNLGLPLDASPKEVHLAYMHKKYWENPEKARQRKMDEYWKDPEKHRERARQRRAKMKECA